MNLEGDILVEIIVHAVNVVCIDHSDCASGCETCLLLEFDGLVVLCNFSMW